MIEQVTPDIPHSSFITDLAIIMILASVVTLAFFKMRQPLIIGYLFAGMLIGPLSPIWASLLPEGENFMGFGQAGLLSDLGLLNIFAELGVILLLFVIGIEFPYSKIRSIGKVAIGAGTIGLFLTLGIVFYVAGLAGLNFMDSLFLGAALSITSTAVLSKFSRMLAK
jgi:CPA2 family monovalent cation:H+ antiporter-2